MKPETKQADERCECGHPQENHVPACFGISRITRDYCPCKNFTTRPAVDEGDLEAKARPLGWIEVDHETETEKWVPYSLEEHTRVTLEKWQARNDATFSRQEVRLILADLTREHTADLQSKVTVAEKLYEVDGILDELLGGISSETAMGSVCEDADVVERFVADYRAKYSSDTASSFFEREPNVALGERLHQLALLDLSTAIIAVDFDGTCVMHDFPRIGQDVPLAADVLRALSAAGAKLIVWTIRSDQASIKNDPHSLADGTAGQELDKEFLRGAIQWFIDRGIRLYGMNCNPQQIEWSSSPKCYAHAYIDDAALGCPLVFDEATHSRPYVDWDAMLTLLLDRFKEFKG